MSKKAQQENETVEDPGELVEEATVDEDQENEETVEDPGELLEEVPAGEEQEKKKTVEVPAELLEETGLVLEEIVERLERVEQAVQEHRGRLEAHGIMLKEGKKAPAEAEGMEKEEYPESVRQSTKEDEWVRVTPRVDYCSPGITINHFTVPCYQGVPTWMPPQFLAEARSRGIL